LAVWEDFLLRTGKHRYRCQNPNYPHQSFLLTPTYKGHFPEIKEQIIDMALDGSGIRDTARVLDLLYLSV
jgi:transposase-like protein